MSYLTSRSADADVRIMSSNILFDKTLSDRLPLIDDYYRASDADVIGMQEVNRVGTALFETLSDIYAPVALRHPEDKHCFTPIIYRHDRFELLEGGSQLYRSRGNNMRDLCVLYTDGTMQIHYAKPDHELIRQQTAEGRIWQTWAEFGGHQSGRSHR